MQLGRKGVGKYQVTYEEVMEGRFVEELLLGMVL